MVLVRLPSMLRSAGVPAELEIREPVSTIADLIAVLDRRVPGVAEALDDTLYSIAINDALVLQKARAHPIHAGDIVELVPTIAGG